MKIYTEINRKCGEIRSEISQPSLFQMQIQVKLQRIFKSEFKIKPLQKMSDKIPTAAKKTASLDWLVRGVLTKIGETFDGLTGRKWQPSSSLATSELTERLKNLLDAEAKDLESKGKFVPHIIKLKMQWDKFSTDAETALKKLEHELLIAAIDHINDRRYHTFAPLTLEIKPDYFTEGVKLSAGFDKFSENEHEAHVNVSVPDLKNVQINPAAEPFPAEPDEEIYAADYLVEGAAKRVRLAFAGRQRLNVGRTKENDLQIDDHSVSKIHAALILNSDKQLMVADTGSTNGTFINNQRIAYGKAVVINAGDRLKFGTVEITFQHIAEKAVEPALTIATNAAANENSPGGFDFGANRTADAGRNLPTAAETSSQSPGSSGEGENHPPSG